MLESSTSPVRSWVNLLVPSYRLVLWPPWLLAARDKKVVPSSEPRPPASTRVAAGRSRAPGRRRLVHRGRQRPDERVCGKLCV